MKKVFFAGLICILFLSACKTDEEKTTNWVLQKEGTWLVVRTEWTRTIVTQSTLVETGEEFRNAIFDFTSASEGNFEMTVPWRTENWLEPYTWSAVGDTAHGGYGETVPDSLGGVASVSFSAFRISKKQMRILFTYIYVTGTELETIEMLMDADLRD